MGIKFSVQTSGFDEVQRAIARACTAAEHELAQQMERDTQPFVPMRTGSLMVRTKIHPDYRGEIEGNAIVYPGPYARFLYYGKVMVDPNTGSTYAPKGGTKVVTDRNLVFNHTAHPQAQAHWCEASKAQNLDKWLRVAEKAVKKHGTG